MKSKLKTLPPPKDNPATRKKRLQARLQEISVKGEQEITAITQALERVKAAFKSEKKSR